MGGISTWKDAAEFLLLGAGSLQVCTAVMHYGFRIMEDLCDGLSNWMDAKGFGTIAEFRGRSLERISDFKDLDLSFRAVARIDPAKCIKCDLCYVACNDTAHQCIDLVRTVATCAKRMASTASAARAGSGLRRLPPLLQRMSGRKMHRDGGSAAAPRIHNLGPVVQDTSRGNRRLGSDERISQKDGNRNSLMWGGPFLGRRRAFARLAERSNTLPKMPLLIRNADIVTADSRSRADIWIENETITRIGANLEAPPGAEIIDAAGRMVFPGFIDPHVHIYLPFMATFAKDTHETGSIAALMGGTTTYIEMVCPSRFDDALEGYQLWKGKAEGASACDYTFHMAVTRFEHQTEGQLTRDCRATESRPSKSSWRTRISSAWTMAKCTRRWPSRRSWA